MCKCLETSCNKEAKKRGYCEKHYREKLKNGELKRIEKNPKTCEVCGNSGKTIKFNDKFYCTKHYRQMKNKGYIDDYFRGNNEGYKICKSCGKEKPLSEFGKCERMKDGHLNQCKECKYKKYRNSKTFICKQCGKEFHSHDNDAKFCSRECFKEFSKKSIIIKCDYCGKETIKQPNELSGHDNHFCSADCRSKYVKDNKLMSGENNPRYNPNKTQEERERERNYDEYYEWRRKVYERDNYTCQCCGCTESNSFNAHHLNSYDWCIDGRTNVDNGVTICKKCHKNFHKLFGYGNNTKEQYEEFLSLIHGNTEEN